MDKPHKIGIALSGGGARGIAHIGALQALEENGIKADCLAGTSAGSIVAALYASGKKPARILEFVSKNSSLFKIYKFGLPTVGLTKLSYLSDKLEEFIGDDSFESLLKPCYIAVTNLHTGQVEVKSQGELFDVIVASCSIPLVFQPIEIDGFKYVDGGLLMNLPAEPLYTICDKVIGINVMPVFQQDTKNITNIIDIASRCFDLALVANTENQSLMCDVVIEPMKICNFTTYNFTKYEDLYQVGYEATMEIMDTIKAKLAEENRTLEA